MFPRSEKVQGALGTARKQVRQQHGKAMRKAVRDEAVEGSWALNTRRSTFGIWLEGSGEPQPALFSSFEGEHWKSPRCVGGEGLKEASLALATPWPSWAIPTCWPAAEQEGSSWVFHPWFIWAGRGILACR